MDDGGQAGRGGAGAGGDGIGGSGDPSGANGSGGVTSSGGEGASGGMSGAGAATGGAAGDDSSAAGESSGGAGGDCQNWCSAQEPACCAEQLRCVDDTPACRIDVLAETVDVTYEYADLVEQLRLLSSAVEITIPLAEVERAAVDAPPAARFEMTLGSAASADLAARGDLVLHPFRVSCDDQELFVGVVYQPAGAAAIRTPVLHIEESEDGARVLRLGAWQGAWLSGSSGNDELRERIDRAELRTAFCERGILDQLEQM